MEKDWLRAAERYEAAKQPGFKERPKSQLPNSMYSLSAFLGSSDGEAAKKLLAASCQDITLGYSEAMMSRTTAVILDGEGLKTLSGVVGMAAAYANEEPVRTPVDVAKAIDLLRNFPEEGNLLEDHFDGEALIKNICKKLDEIAAAAPKGTAKAA